MGLEEALKALVHIANPAEVVTAITIVVIIGFVIIAVGALRSTSRRN